MGQDNNLVDLKQSSLESEDQNKINYLDIITRFYENKSDHDAISRLMGELSSKHPKNYNRILELVILRLCELSEVTNRVSGSLSLDVMLPQMVELCSHILNADRCTIFLNDQNNGELYSRVAQGDLMSEIRFPNDKGIASSVFQSNKSEIINDPYSDPRFNPEVDKNTGYKTENILCVPIRTAEGNVIGVAQVLNKKETQFSNNDCGLLELITSQAALMST